MEWWRVGLAFAGMALVMAGFWSGRRGVLFAAAGMLVLAGFAPDIAHGFGEHTPGADPTSTSDATP